MSNAQNLIKTKPIDCNKVKVIKDKNCDNIMVLSPEEIFLDMANKTVKYNELVPIVEKLESKYNKMIVSYDSIIILKDNIIVELTNNNEFKDNIIKQQVSINKEYNELNEEVIKKLDKQLKKNRRIKKIALFSVVGNVILILILL